MGRGQDRQACLLQLAHLLFWASPGFECVW